MEKNNSETYTKWRNNTLVARMETDKKYMILRMGNFLISTAGFGWYVIYMLRGIRIAIENGFIPVIDWMSCKIPQYSADKIGKENVWEYFFEQPCHVSVNEAYKSGDFFVIDNVREIVHPISFDIGKFIDFYDRDTIAWREYFQKYIRLRKEILKDFENQRQNVRLNHSVGILARGTDYAELKPVGHSMPVSVEEICTYVDLLPDTKRLFLATEDKEILKKFMNRYPGRIDIVAAKRYEHLGNNTLNVIYGKDENGYERDMKYLYSLYMISRCEVCIYSACGGGVLASLMRENSGTDYKFLYHGCNRAKGIIVGSDIEKKQNRMVYLGKKPILFYTLNTLKLLGVEEVDLILNDSVGQEYQKIIGSGEKFGMKISYIVSDSYDILEYMMKTPGFMTTSKLILLYADYFIHGKDVIKDLSEKVNGFDGAYIWGTQTYFSIHTESLKLCMESGIPEKAYDGYFPSNYSLVGRYVFDYELTEIIEQIKKEKDKRTLADIVNEYIHRRKIFFEEYKRGIFCSEIKNENILEMTGKVINLIEEIQGKKIGDFESFRSGKI